MGKIEDEVLQKFEKVARGYGFCVYKGQGNNNKIMLRDTPGFQFGDLRIDVGTHYVIVETESGGGVTNLCKYWYCLEQKFIKKPVALVHIYRNDSKRGYKSHEALWEFMWSKMRQSLGNMMEAKCYAYHKDDNLSSALDSAVREFERQLKRNWL